MSILATAIDANKIKRPGALITFSPRELLFGAFDFDFPKKKQKKKLCMPACNLQQHYKLIKTADFCIKSTFISF